MAVGFDFVEIATATGRKAPSRILLLCDGDIKWADLDGVQLDQDAADRIIKKFDRQGADLPIDYHHATTAVEDGKLDKAPAAGWVKSLVYVAGEGLFGIVEWSPTAAGEIESKAFKYVSPVIFTDKKTGEINELHSVALTNRPRTIDAPALLEAAEAQRVDTSDDLINEPLRSKPMPKDKKPKPKNMRRVTAWRLLTAQDEALPGIDVDTEALPEDQVAEIDEVGDAITKLAEALSTAGVEVPEGAGSVDIISLAIDAVAGGGAADDEASEETANATTDEVAAALGLPKGSKLKTICGEAKAMKVKMGGAGDMEGRLAEVEGELKGYRDNEKARTAKGLVSDAVKAGKINPNSGQHMAQCLSLATDDPERFTLMFANASVVCPPEGTTVTTTGGAPGKTDRDRLIVAAAKEYDGLTEGQQGQTDKRGYVTAAIYEVGEKAVTDTEVTKHKLEANG